MINEFHKKGNQLLILSLIITSICICIVSLIVNYVLLKKTVKEETASSIVQDGEFLKVSHPIKIADFENYADHPLDPDGGFFIITVKDHEYLIYKNNLSHRFGMTHYPDCKCIKK